LGLSPPCYAEVEVLGRKASQRFFDTWEEGGGVLLYNPCGVGADNLPDYRFYLGSATVLPHSTRIAAAGWWRIMAQVEMGYRGKRDITLPLAAFYLSTYELDISR